VLTRYLVTSSLVIGDLVTRVVVTRYTVTRDVEIRDVEIRRKQVHPSVLESLAQQRIEDLRSSSCSSRGSRGRRPSKNDSPSEGTAGPIGRTQARLGTWMVDAGTKLVYHGAGAEAAAPRSDRSDKIAA
jgi:hypothetical protein